MLKDVPRSQEQQETGEPQNITGSTRLNSAWYAWTAPASGSFTFDTCTTPLDTTLGLYTGTAVNALTKLKGDNDGCGVTAGGSKTTITAVSGTVYHISVDGFGSATGAFTLKWAPAP